MARLLIADDQVPDDNLSSEKEVRDHYLAVYGRENAAFVEGFVFLRRLIILLRERAYEVDCANTPLAVMDLAKRNTYDAIILDLGWDTLESMSHDERMVLGWQLAKQIRQNSSAPILMFSARFYENDELARTAAENHLLPVYKSYDEACKKNLLVTIRWATEQMTLADRLSAEQKLYALRMYRRLSNALMGSILLGSILVGVTLVQVLRNDFEVTAASTLFGLVSSFISGVIYKYVREYQKSLRR